MPFRYTKMPFSMEVMSRAGLQPEPKKLCTLTEKELQSF